MFAAVMAMAFFLFQLGIAEAGVSTLYPGAGNRPPKTPEWNVEKSRDENASAKAAEKNGGAAKGVKKLDKKNVPMTMLSVMLGENLASASVSGASDFEVVDGNAGKVLESCGANKSLNITVDGSYIAINGMRYRFTPSSKTAV